MESRLNACRQHIEELELNIRTHPTLTPSSNFTLYLVIEEILRSQYYSFMAVSQKVAAVHDASVKMKEMLEQYQVKHGGPRTGTGSKESFLGMASMLLPQGQSQGQSQGGNSSLFGGGNKTSTGTLGNTGTASTGMFGNTGNTSTGMFGNTGTTSTGMFGNTGNTSTGMFGNAASKPSTGLFGASTTPATGLFGNTTAAPATNTGLFGNTANTTGLFGSTKRSNSLGT